MRTPIANGPYPARRSAQAASPCDPAPVIVALFGPTGVGKTEVAIALAEALRGDGEDPVAVSADALQLYAGLEILTGAATAEQRARLEHRLVGTLPLSARATAGDFARRAHAEIDALVAAGRRPIVVGGTGLYLRAALADLDLRPPPDPAVRERYARRIADEGVRGAPRRPAGPRPGGRRRGSPPPTPSAWPARSSCSTRGEHAVRRRPAVDAPHAAPDAARRARRWSARRSTRGSTPASTRWSPPARRTRCGAPTRRARRRPPARRWASPSCSPATSPR